MEEWTYKVVAIVLPGSSAILEPQKGVDTEMTKCLGTSIPGWLLRHF